MILRTTSILIILSQHLVIMPYEVKSSQTGLDDVQRERGQRERECREKGAEAQRRRGGEAERQNGPEPGEQAIKGLL